MGDAGGEQALAIAPGASVEDSGDGSEQDVTPVEWARLVEVREAEDGGGEDDRAGAAKTGFEHVLQESAEEKFFGDGDEEEGDQKSGSGGGGVRQSAVRRDEVKGNAERDDDRGEEEKLAKSDEEIAQARSKVVTDVVERASHEEGVQGGVDHQEFREGVQAVMRKRAVKPVEFDGEADDGEGEDVLPADFRGCGMRTSRRQELVERAGADRNGKREKEEGPAEFTARERIYKVGDDEQRWGENASCGRDETRAEIVGEPESEKPERREDQGESSERAGEMADAGAERKVLREEPEGNEGDSVEGGCSEERCAAEDAGEHGNIVAGEWRDSELPPREASQSAERKPFNRKDRKESKENRVATSESLVTSL